MFALRYAALAATLSVAAPGAALADTRVAIPGGTPASVRLVEKIDSGTANVGVRLSSKRTITS